MATCKSILVHLKTYQDWSPAIDAAIALAQKYDARLTGLYTIRELAMIKLVLGSDHRATRSAKEVERHAAWRQHEVAEVADEAHALLNPHADEGRDTGDVDEPLPGARARQQQQHRQNRDHSQ